MKARTNLFQVDSKSKILNDEKAIFERSLNSFAASEVYINNSSEITKVMIREKYDSNGEQLKIQARVNEISRGDIINYRGDYWMVTSIPESDEVFAKAMISYCGSNFPYYEKGEKVLVVDKNGKPVLNIYGDEQYKEATPINIDIPCFIDSSFFNKDTNTQLPIIDGSIYITIPYNKDRKISYNYEFKMFENKYKISYIDYSNVSKNQGIIRLICKVVI